MFLGVTRAMRPGAEALLPEPNRTIKDDAKWDVKRRELLATAQAKAPHWPMTGYVQEWSLLDWSGSVVGTGGCEAGDTAGASVQFCRLLVATPGIIPHLVSEPRTCMPVRWFGFEIRTSLAMIAMEVMHFNSTRPPEAQQPVPWHIWWHPHFTTTPFLDPFDTMLPSAVRSASKFTAVEMVKYFNLQHDSALPLAQQQAEFVRTLIKLSGALNGLGA